MSSNSHGPIAPRMDLRSGVPALIAYAAFSAGFDVYAGNRLQEHSPLVVAALSFTMITIFFLGWDLTTHKPADVLRPAWAHRADVAAINATTAAGWLTMLYALVYLEPAIVNVVGLAIGPVLTVLLGPLLLRHGRRTLSAEVVASAGICVFLAALVWSSFAGHSAVGELSAGHALIGLALTLLSGLASTGNVIFSKRLSDAGFGVRAILSVRFPLTLLAAWIMTLVVDGTAGLGPALPTATVVAALGVGLPLYLIQVGIRHTEPITASLLCSLSPSFAILLQLPDQRLSVSTPTVACIIAITSLIALGVLARHRYERQFGKRHRDSRAIASNASVKGSQSL